MSFARPEALLLLLLVVPVLFWSFRGRWRSTRPSAESTALRVLLLILLVVALARPALVRDDAPPIRVLVGDLSSSVATPDAVRERVDELAAELAEDAVVRRVFFGERAWTEDEGVYAATVPEGAEGHGSDIGGALGLAASLIPEGREGGIHLVTDGRETRGALRAAVLRCQERGIPVDTAATGLLAPRPLLGEIELPAAARVGSTIEIRARVAALQDGAGRVVLTGVQPEGPAVSVPIEVRNGVAEVVLEHEVAAVGLNVLRLALEGSEGAVVAGCVRTLALHGTEPLRVWLVGDGDVAAARGAAARILGPGVALEARAASSLSGDEDLAALDGLILDDVPAAALSPRFQERLRDAAADGLGVIVAGGRRSFGPGGYADTPLEQMLPVRFLQKEERRDPSATLVIIIDTSGSMGGNRMELAKEVARLALQRLKPHDKAGIVEFHGAKRWAAAIQSAANSVDLQRALNRLTAGGGTVILPAIEEAYYGLLNARTRTRHVLVITDGGVEQGAFEPLMRKMSNHGMTVSTVLVGPGSHSAFLVSLAQWGRGRFYHAPDRFNLPEAIVKQPESSLLAPYVEEPTKLLLGPSAGRFLGALDLARAPALEGVLECEPRGTAEVVLETAAGQPALSRWRYGLGQVAAWTTQLTGSWVAGLSAWEGYPRLLTGLLREGAPARRPGEAWLRLVPRRNTLTVYASLEAGEDPEKALVIRVTPQGAAPRRRRIEGTQGEYGAAAYGVVFADLPSGICEVAVESTDGRVLGEAATALRPTDDEWTRLSPDRALLGQIAEITGGRSDGTLTSLDRRGRHAQELWPLFLALAIPVFLLQVLLRRLR